MGFLYFLILLSEISSLKRRGEPEPSSSEYSRRLALERIREEREEMARRAAMTPEERAKEDRAIACWHIISGLVMLGVAIYLSWFMWQVVFQFHAIYFGHGAAAGAD